jgi:hypothetical protein
MSFVDRLFGQSPDPTLAWGEGAPAIPEFNLGTMSFGSLCFGASMESAAFLGRPDRFAWKRKAYGELLYAARGFQLDFDDDKLSCLAFLIGPDEFQPKHEALAFAQPRLRGCHPEPNLRAPVDAPTLERLLGEPDFTQTEVEGTIITYSRSGITMEFELDATSGTLKRWNLFPE